MERILILSIYFFSCFIGKAMINMPNQSGIFFVSPQGNDANSGSVSKPWKTLFKVASTLTAGQTAIFEDGLYQENKVVHFKNSGNALSPIIIRSKNKHKAKIFFGSLTRSSAKINILGGKKYIVIKDFEITQQTTANDSDKRKTLDIFIACRNSSYCSFIGNEIHDAFEEGIKVNASDNVLIDSNSIYNTQHEGVDMVNVSNSVVSNNNITNIGRIGIVAKGGSRNIKLLNNIILNNDRIMSNTSIAIGGITNLAYAYNKEKTEFEAYDIVAFNNKIIASKAGLVINGISFLGAKNCYSYNNIIVGANRGFYFKTILGKKKGWDFDPTNLNIIVKNNIVLDCTKKAFMIIDQPTNLVSDFNLFYNSATPPTEPNSRYDNPLFYNKLNDWRLRPNSPAKGSGSEVSWNYIMSLGQTTSVKKSLLKEKQSSDIGAFNFK